MWKLVNIFYWKVLLENIWFVFPLLIHSFPPKNQLHAGNKYCRTGEFWSRKAVVVPKAAGSLRGGAGVSSSQLMQFVNPQSAALSWELLGAGNSPGLSSPNPEPRAAPGSGCGCRGCSLLVWWLFPSSATLQGASPRCPLDLVPTGSQLNPAQVSSWQAVSLVTRGGYQPADSWNAS